MIFEKILETLRGNKRRGDFFKAPFKFVLTQEQKKFWEANGYLVLPKFFDLSVIHSLNQEIEDLWKAPTQNCPLVVDIYIGSNKERRILLRNAPSDARSAPFKLNDMYLESDQVRSVLLNQRLGAVLYELLGGAPLLCNSLNFIYGSQQPFHTDSLYMTPPVGLNLAAAWIALEDCSPDAGPLRYYPGSHKIPPFRFKDGRMTATTGEMDAYKNYMRTQVAHLGLKEEIFCAQEGDVFLWHSQLFHGGSPIKNPKLTRKSLVSHYFRAGDVETGQKSWRPGLYYLERSHQPVSIGN